MGPLNFLHREEQEMKRKQIKLQNPSFFWKQWAGQAHPNESRFIRDELFKFASK
jgi:hypothetical protein